ncbi:MAG: sigma-70 family RNA polymerase sigma factor [Rhodococcus sp. (in: high G+C Gram-positive bacteria)]|nr:MAG: sigma-70 family RNA polymerase sigma factor [Rhodococcus sp. (in: high G+C Gram-positive bacteria)]
MTAPDDRVRAAVDAAFRDEWGQVVATLIGLTGDWDLAEDCAQDAFAFALTSWTRDGVPRRPGAWLTTTARNRAIDRLRRDAAGAGKVRQLAVLTRDPGEPPEEIPDERLRLIFTCCHPALPFPARVALTLRTLAGLSTAEIARAFLTAESTMAQRLVRAKRKIQEAGIPYRVPPVELLPQRLAAALAVLYLIFNQGYDEEERHRALTAEAIRLARLLVGLMTREPEPRGLLALMLLHESRRATRTDDDGVLVSLENQDRSRWDPALIAEGVATLDQALAMGRTGGYQVQAAIAACHATAPDAASTDWPQIAALYTELARLAPSPVVDLNHAVAVAMADGIPAGLALVDEITASGRLDRYHLLPATRADLLRRDGRAAEAEAAYEQALKLAPTEAERRYLTSRLREL